MKKIVLSLALGATLAMAGAPDTPKDDKLVTHTELGYINTGGNTNTDTFNLDAKVKKGWERHIGTFTLDGQYATQDGHETKNKYFTELEYDYEFTDRISFGYLVGYKSDKFSRFDWQFYTGPSAKYKLIVSKIHNLSVEGNILYADDRYSDVEYDASGAVINYPNPDNIAVAKTDPAYSNDYTSYRAKGVYTWQMLKNLKFDQELTYRGSFEDGSNYFVYSKTGFTSKLSDIFSAGISYKVDYVNEPGDKKNTDTTFTIGLIIDY